jgi:hypothetical protein
MEKKYIVGGLAVVGVIALIAYLNKPKKNSEGFFNAIGKNIANLPTEENPNSFIRKGGFPSGCALYQKTMTPNGVIYTKRRVIGLNSIGSETFPITEVEFIQQSKSTAFCRKM